MSVRTVLEGAGVAVMAGMAWVILQKPVAAPVGQQETAQKAPEVVNAKKQDIRPKTVKAYANSVKDVLGLQMDDNIAVLDSSKLPESDHSQTVTAVLNTETGETRMLVTTDPYPWLTAENAREVRLSYGFKSGARVARMSFSDDLVQVKAFHLGVTAAIDSDSSWFVGAGVAYRW